MRKIKTLIAIVFAIAFTISLTGISNKALATFDITCGTGGQGLCYEEECISVECFGEIIETQGCKATGDPEDCCECEDPCS